MDWFSMLGMMSGPTIGWLIVVLAIFIWFAYMTHQVVLAIFEFAGWLVKTVRARWARAHA